MNYEVTVFVISEMDASGDEAFLEWLQKLGFTDCATIARSKGMRSSDILQMTADRVEKEFYISDPSLLSNFST
jgi:hypothetical protein